MDKVRSRLQLLRLELNASVFSSVLWWALLFIIALSPFVLGGRIIVPGADTINYYYPAMYWFSDALKNGDSFLWNPTILSGFPSYLSQVSGYIEPLNIILFLFTPSFLLAYHLRLLIDFILVSLFSYLIARKWGVSNRAAFLIGPTYLMAFHWWYLSNTVIANTLFLLPFLLWVYVCARDSEKAWKQVVWGMAGGVGVGWVFLGGYAQIAIYCLVLVGLYALYDYFFILDASRRAVRFALRLSGVLTLFASIGFMVGSPQILAALAHTALSVRDGGLSYAETQAKVLRLSEFVYFLFPDYLRLPLFNGGRKPLFIGFLSLLFAVVAISQMRHHKAVRGPALLFFFALITALPYSPIFYILHHLPVFELFRYPYRWMYLGVWALAVLGAFGFDFMSRSSGGKFVRILALCSALMAGTLGCAIVLASFAGDWFWQPVKEFALWLFATLVYAPDAHPKGFDHYAGAVYRSIDAWRALISLSNEYFLVAYLSLAAGSALFLARSYERVSTRLFELCATILIVCTFLGVFAVRWQDSLQGSVIWGAREKVLSIIPSSDLPIYRLAQFDPGHSFKPRNSNLIWNTEDTNTATDLAHFLAVPNVNQYVGISLIDGYEPFITRDLLAVTAGTLASTYTSQDVLVGMTFDDRKNMFLSRLDIIGMMGGKYVMMGTEVNHPDLVLLGTIRASAYETPSYIYENKLAWPRVYLATQTESFPHASVIELVEDHKTFESITYLDCDACSRSGSAESNVVIQKLGNGYFEIIVDAWADEWLIISENFLPGWVASIDGEVVVPTRANGMYMALPIRSGSHRVILQYEGIRHEGSWLRLLGLYPYPPISQQ